MDVKRMLTGTIVGGITLWATGYVIFDMAFRSFYAANAGSATGVDRSPQVLWAMWLSSLAYAALITVAMGNRAGKLSIGAGAIVGAIVGCLTWGTADFILYGSTNIANLTRTIVDPVLEFVHGGVGGAVIALVVGGLSGAVKKAEHTVQT